MLQALADADRPLKTSEVARIVGKSTPATSNALREAGATPVAGVYPTEWATGGDTVLATRLVPSKFDDVQYVVIAADTDNLVQVWNDKREDLASNLAKLSITPKSDPKKTAIQLGTIAGSIGALAYNLHVVAGKPDWYHILTDNE